MYLADQCSWNRARGSNKSCEGGGGGEGGSTYVIHVSNYAESNIPYVSLQYIYIYILKLNRSLKLYVPVSFFPEQPFTRGYIFTIQKIIGGISLFFYYLPNSILIRDLNFHYHLTLKTPPSADNSAHSLCPSRLILGR